MSAPSGGHEEGRLRRAGRAAEALLADLEREAAALRARAAFVEGELRLGRLATAEAREVAGLAAGMEAMLADVLAALRDETLSPEAAVEVRPLVDREVSALVERLRPVEVRLTDGLPPGVAVAGRASLLSRLVRGALAEAAGRARDEVRLSLELRRSRRGSPRLLLRVDDDGDGPAVPPSATGIDSAAWAAERLGGRLVRGAAAERGGRIAARIPAVRIPAADDGRLAGLRVAAVGVDGGAALRAADLLDGRCGALFRLPTDGAPEDGGDGLLVLLGELRPHAVLLEPEAMERGGLRLLARLDDGLARRTLLVTRLRAGDPLLDEAIRTGRPMLVSPVAPGELADALARLNDGVGPDASPPSHTEDDGA